MNCVILYIYKFEYRLPKYMELNYNRFIICQISVKKAKKSCLSYGNLF